MHDKLMVVDGRVLLAGGRNIESPYFGLGEKQLGRRNYLDCDVQVWGGTAAVARSYFLEVWDSREVRALAARASPEERARAAGVLDGYAQWLDARIRAARRTPEPILRPPIIVEAIEGAKGAEARTGVRFLHDPVGRKGRSPGVGHELLALMEGARESVVIESPYLVPSRAFRRGLARTLARGVTVRILTNSLATTDNLFPQAGYASHKAWLVRQGVELWEYTGPECLHTKAAVIDGEQVIVGSFNLDPRSEHLNTELALVIGSRRAAAALRASMDSHLGRATRIDARGMPEGASEPYPGVPRSKVARLHLLRLLAPLIKKQL
jgi:putative cardiolipin synthase